MTALCYWYVQVTTDNQDGPALRQIQFADQELHEAKTVVSNGRGGSALWVVSCHSAVLFDSKYICHS